MNIRRIDHVQLAMPAGREEEARTFYGDVLGIPEKPKPAHLAKRGGVWFESGALKVHLGVEADFRPARKAHPAFEVGNLAEPVEACRKAGYRVVADESLEGYERAYVYDPFDNRIVVF
jgi:catechol 2,3-dioxygenase-like lactoylglutathione lyase family enzyme